VAGSSATVLAHVRQGGAKRGLAEFGLISPRMVQTCAMPAPEIVDEFTEPHFNRSALLLIDTQLDFLDGGASPIGGTTERLSLMMELVQAYREAGLPIIHVVRLYEGDDIDLVRRRSLVPDGQVVRAGSRGADLPTELRLDPTTRLDADLLLSGRFQQVGPNEVIMWKPRWSAFYRTPLDAHLTDLDIDTVVIAGCNFPNCPRATIFDASERDLRIVIADDAVSQTTPERLSDAEAIGARRASAAQVIQRLPAKHLQADSQVV